MKFEPINSIKVVRRFVHIEFLEKKNLEEMILFHELIEKKKNDISLIYIRLIVYESASVDLIITAFSFSIVSSHEGSCAACDLLRFES